MSFKKMKGVLMEPQGRREFVITAMKTAAVAGVFLTPVGGWSSGVANANFTVQQVIDLILKSIPNAPFKQTVDTIKAGDANQVVTGIVTTMFATAEVIEKAAKLGANFIIAHEPTFYNHNDDAPWLEGDEVYKYKRELLNKHKIAVWRFHDYIHSHRPDGVMMGVFQALGWEKYFNPEKPHLASIPPASLENIIQLVKARLGIPHLRIIGDKSAICAKIVIAPGSAGGRRQIEAIRNEKPDLFMCGELDEWETSEYIRDLRKMGGKTSLIVLGHIPSEEPGLQWLVNWLQPQVPGIKVHHIPSQDAFTWT